MGVERDGELVAAKVGFGERLGREVLGLHAVLGQQVERQRCQQAGRPELADARCMMATLGGLPDRVAMASFV